MKSLLSMLFGQEEKIVVLGKKLKKKKKDFDYNGLNWRKSATEEDS